jgi:hypothetical protein
VLVTDDHLVPADPVTLPATAGDVPLPATAGDMPLSATAGDVPLPATAGDPTSLSREQCWQLVASAAYGRIVYTVGALPAVWPVTFSRDGEELLFDVDAGGTLAEASRDSVLAFHADFVRASDGQGWSVTMTGRSRHVAGTEMAGASEVHPPRVTVALAPKVIAGYRAQVAFPRAIAPEPDLD